MRPRMSPEHVVRQSVVGASRLASRSACPVALRAVKMRLRNCLVIVSSLIVVIEAAEDRALANYGVVPPPAAEAPPPAAPAPAAPLTAPPGATTPAPSRGDV